MEMQTQDVKRTAIYIRLGTRDRINLLRARFGMELGRPVTQDEALAALFDVWEAEHEDSEVVRYATK